MSLLVVSDMLAHCLGMHVGKECLVPAASVACFSIRAYLASPSCAVVCLCAQQPMCICWSVGIVAEEVVEKMPPVLVSLCKRLIRLALFALHCTSCAAPAALPCCAALCLLCCAAPLTPPCYGSLLPAVLRLLCLPAVAPSCAAPAVPCCCTSCFAMLYHNSFLIGHWRLPA